MEKWQQTYIIQNLPYLIENIDCSTLLLSYFLSGGLFSNEDVDKIITIGKYTGKYEQTRTFLDMLTSRTGAFEHLVKTLFTCKKTGATITLLNGVEEHYPGINPFLKCGIHIKYHHLLQRKVFFGGVELPLLEICNLLNHDDIYPLLNDLMNVDLYKKLSSDSQITLIKQTIPPNIRYYIPRSLYFDNELDIIALKKLDTTFVVQDITSFELKNIVEIAAHEIILIDKSSSQLQILTAKFIILETPDHFEKLAKISTQPIYWIRYFTGKLLHVKSSGDGATSLIRPFLKKYRTTTCEQDEFLKMSLEAPRCLPILIFDSPGTGKSTLFAYLANQLKQSYQTRSVLFVRMPDLLQFFVSTGVMVTITALKDFLLKITTSGDRFAAAMQNILLDSQNHKIELFLDGLDEVREEDTGLSRQVLQLIYNDISNIRIWLTSRLTNKYELEELFGVIGYRIVPFKNIDQVNFLAKYWQTENGVIYSDGLHILAVKCLEAFKTKVSRAERDLAGIPLQCKLLANICTEYALRENTYFSEEELTVNSIHSMYKIYVNKQLGTGNFKENLNCHIHLALRLIFPNVIVPYRLKTNPEHFYKMCILEPNYKGKPKFVHQTFADYFVAEYVLNFLQTGNPQVKILYSPLEFIFTEILKYRDAPKLEIIEDTPNLQDTLKTKHFYNATDLFVLLNCCLENNLVNLFSYIVCLYSTTKYRSAETLTTRHREIIFNHFGAESRYFRDDINLASVDYWEVLLLVASKYSSVTLLKYTCDLVQIANEKCYNEIDFTTWKITPMSVAAQRGNFEVVAYLLQLGKNQFEIWDSPIHECLYNSLNDDSNIVEEKINILRQLEFAKPDIFGLLNTGKDYPILVKNIHFLLIKFLVEKGAKMNKRRKGNNVAHLAATYMTADDFHDLVKLAEFWKYTNIFRETNEFGFTPFHLALKYIELRPDTIELLHRFDSGPGFGISYTHYNQCVPYSFGGNSYSYYAFTLLSFAIEGRRTNRVFDDLMNAYKKFDFSSNFEHNLLCLCLCFNNLKALNFFIDKGLHTNKRCEFNTKTLLSHAMLCNDEFRNKAICLLIEKGANVNGVFLEQEFGYARFADVISFKFVSPLKFAEKYNLDTHIISLLKSKGAEYHNRQCVWYSILLRTFMVFTNPCGFSHFSRFSRFSGVTTREKEKSFTRYFSNKMFILGSVGFIIYVLLRIFQAVGYNVLNS